VVILYNALTGCMGLCTQKLKLSTNIADAKLAAEITSAMMWVGYD
jgi:hypothetical protein